MTRRVPLDITPAPCPDRFQVGRRTLVWALWPALAAVCAATLAGSDALPPAAPAAPANVAATVDPAAAVRRATERLLDAWNRHDLAAWSALLTDDVWYAETDDTFYKRSRGREQVIGRFEFDLRNSTLQWDVKQIRTLPDGSVSVRLRQVKTMLPDANGKPGPSFGSDPALARWRRDGDGWRLAFFTSHKGWALAEAQKDEAAVAASAASAATGPAAAATARPFGEASAPAASANSATSTASAAGSAPAADRVAGRAVASPLGDPPAYTRGWGEWSQGCVYCHGRPPTLPHSEAASRIVAVGAAQPDAAALRQAMSRPALGEPLNRMLADPELTDDQLETIRHYLVAVRDGELPATVELQPDGAQAVTFRSLRHDRDPPVRIAELEASAGWRIERSSRCRVGLALCGQQACKLIVRRLAGTVADGQLRVRLAPTPGLQPEPRVLRLPPAS
jgi:ketosteroid isomerase-like protein